MTDTAAKPTVPLGRMAQAGMFDPPPPTTATVTLYANCGHPDTFELSPGQSLTIRGEPMVCAACNAAQRDDGDGQL